MGPRRVALGSRRRALPATPWAPAVFCALVTLACSDATAPTSDTSASADVATGASVIAADPDPLGLPPGPPYTWEDHALPLYEHYCGRCHIEKSPGQGCTGGLCFVTHRSVLLGPACCAEGGEEFGVCTGVERPNPGEVFAICTVRRMRATIKSVETGKGRRLQDFSPIIAKEEHMRILEEWIAAGQP